MATFGKTTIGAFSQLWAGGNDLVGYISTCPSNGTADNITVCLGDNALGIYVKCAIYKNSDLSFVGETVERYFASGTAGGWQTFNFSAPKPPTANIEYLLCVWASSDYGTKYDAGYAGQTARDVHVYDSFPATFSKDATYAQDTSIYCTYTPSGVAWTKTVSEILGLVDAKAGKAARKRTYTEILGLVDGYDKNRCKKCKPSSVIVTF